MMSRFDRDGLEQPQPLAADVIAARAVWGLREIVIGGVAVLVLFFLLFAILTLPAVAIWGEDSPTTLGVQVLTAALWDAAIVLSVYRIVRGKGGGWRELGLRWPAVSPSAGAMLRTVLGAYVACIAVVQGYGLALGLLGLEDLLPDRQLPDSLFEHDWVLTGFAVTGVSMVPFAEELFFRGFFFAGLRRRLGFALAALISGAFFSVAHADPGLIIPFTGVGVILAYTYERAGTLFAPMGVHALFNSVSFLILVFVPEARG